LLVKEAKTIIRYDRTTGKWLTYKQNVKRLTEDAKALLWKLRKRSCSINYISKRLGISTKTTWYWLHKFASEKGLPLVDLRHFNDGMSKLPKFKSLHAYLLEKFEKTNDIRWLPNDIYQLGSYRLFEIVKLSKPPFGK